MMHRVRSRLGRPLVAALAWWHGWARSDSKSRPLLMSAIITLCITGAGTWLTDRYQAQAWSRDKQFAVFQQNFEGGLALVDDLAEHMGTRYMGLSRVVWAAKDDNGKNLDSLWTEYYGSVAAWNSKLLRYKGQLSRFIGEDTAETFCSREDYKLSFADGDPQSLHGLFLITQQRVGTLMACAQRACDGDERQAALRDANQALALLGVAIEDFLTSATERVYRRAEANSI